MLTFLSIIFILISLELVSFLFLRWRGAHPPTPWRFNWVGGKLHQYDPILGYRYYKNHPYGKVQTGSAGFVLNDPKESEKKLLPKDSQTKRIFMFGGSAVAGSGASSCDKTMSAQLEKILKEKFPHQNLEVINLGVGGYTCFQELISFLEVVRYQPDLVVVFDAWNDFIYPTKFAGYIDEEAKERMPYAFNEFYLYLKDMARRPVFKIFGISFDLVHFYRSSSLLYLIRRILAAFKLISLPHFDVPSGIEKKCMLSSREAQSQYLHTVKMFINCVRAQGIEIKYFLQPCLIHKENLSDKEKDLFSYRPALKDNLGMVEGFYADLYEKAQRVLGEDVEALYDLAPHVKEVSEEIFIDECHFNDKGYQLMAERMAEQIML